MQRDGSSSSLVEYFRFSSQRTLSLASMGTRVGLTFRFRALVPLNLLRVQNLIAASPSGSPSVVTARLECIRIPQTVCDLRRPHQSNRLDNSRFTTVIWSNEHGMIIKLN